MNGHYALIDDNGAIMEIMSGSINMIFTKYEVIPMPPDVGYISDATHRFDLESGEFVELPMPLNTPDIPNLE